MSENEKNVENVPQVNLPLTPEEAQKRRAVKVMKVLFAMEYVLQGIANPFQGITYQPFFGHFRYDYGLSEAMTQQYFSRSYLAWSFKPVLGFLMDAYGKTKITLIFLLLTGALFYIATPFVDKSATIFFGMMFTLSIAFACTDVAVDRATVIVGDEESKAGNKSKAATVGLNQGICWAAIYGTSIIVGFSGGWIADNVKTNHLLFALALVPLAVLVVVLMLPKDTATSIPIRESIKNFWEGLNTGPILWIILFYFLFHFQPALGALWVNHLIENLQFTQTHLGMADSVSYFGYFLGVLLFMWVGVKWQDRFGLKLIFKIFIVLSILVNLTQYVLVDPWFTKVTDVIHSFMPERYRINDKVIEKFEYFKITDESKIDQLKDKLPIEKFNVLKNDIKDTPFSRDLLKDYNYRSPEINLILTIAEKEKIKLEYRKIDDNILEQLKNTKYLMITENSINKLSSHLSKEDLKEIKLDFLNKTFYEDKLKNEIEGLKFLEINTEPLKEIKFLEIDTEGLKDKIDVTLLEDLKGKKFNKDTLTQELKKKNLDDITIESIINSAKGKELYELILNSALVSKFEEAKLNVISANLKDKVLSLYDLRSKLKGLNIKAKDVELIFSLTDKTKITFEITDDKIELIKTKFNNKIYKKDEFTKNLEELGFDKEEIKSFMEEAQTITRKNVRLYYLFVYNFLVAILASFIRMSTFSLVGAVIPINAAGSLFAGFMSIANLAYSFSYSTGSALYENGLSYKIFGAHILQSIENKVYQTFHAITNLQFNFSLNSGDEMSISLLIFIGSVAYLLSFIAVKMLPDKRQTQAAEDDKVYLMGPESYKKLGESFLKKVNIVSFIACIILITLWFIYFFPKRVDTFAVITAFIKATMLGFFIMAFFRKIFLDNRYKSYLKKNA